MAASKPDLAIFRSISGRELKELAAADADSGSPIIREKDLSRFKFVSNC
ncbi:hypothetical protein SMITH_471 [Smithella sp. ME-1]|nr:hypothetical protein SMITH_471 [Smithella sp. ME-1]